VGSPPSDRFEEETALFLGEIIDDHFFMGRQWPCAPKQFLDRQLETLIGLRRNGLRGHLDKFYVVGVSSAFGGRQ
jgi:hypothetical protein